MKALMNYACACYQQYSVQFADARTKDIVNDTVSSDDLPTRNRSTYNRYVENARQEQGTPELAVDVRIRRDKAQDPWYFPSGQRVGLLCRAENRSAAGRGRPLLFH